jgi:hypothetical protein
MPAEPQLRRPRDRVVACGLRSESPIFSLTSASIRRIALGDAARAADFFIEQATPSFTLAGHGPPPFHRTQYARHCRLHRIARTGC